jgi:hypothetical protein
LDLAVPELVAEAADPADPVADEPLLAAPELSRLVDVGDEADGFDDADFSGREELVDETLGASEEDSSSEGEDMRCWFGSKSEDGFGSLPVEDAEAALGDAGRRLASSSWWICIHQWPINCR